MRPIIVEIFPALILFIFAQYLGGIKNIEPFYTYLYLFSWFPFIWIVDRVYRFRTGRSHLGLKNPAFRSNAVLFLASTSFWLIFEVINFRLNNWLYLGLPTEIWIRWPGYALSYATVLPGIFFLSDFIETFFPSSQVKAPISEIGETKSQRWPLAFGMAMLIFPLIWPKYFFPLIWGSLFFLLEPAVQVWGGHSLLQDWREGRWKKTISLLSAGLICGLFWEGSNFSAGAKWQYTVPFVGFLKIFEMPILGFLGFPAFALELYVMYQFFLRGWVKLGTAQKTLIILAMVLFWAAAFWGIDRFTVFIWR